jgi:pyruvate kinase
MRRTKIIATLGPSCGSPEIVKNLLTVPVDVFRINASHGTHAGHEAHITTVRRLARELDCHPGILFDLQGPKIRLGRFRTGSATLNSASTFTITTDLIMGDMEQASTDYPNLPSDVSAGDRLLVADGAIELRVLRTASTSVVCQVVRGGTIRDHQGINLPNVKLSMPSVTETLRANIDETLTATIITEQGGKEKHRERSQDCSSFGSQWGGFRSSGQAATARLYR